MKLPLIAALAVLYSAAGTVAQCNFCSGGIKVGDDVVVPDAGDTCGSLAANAPDLEADEYYCTDVTLPAESVCCPAGVADDLTTEEPPQEDGGGEGCPVCTNGLTADEDTSLGQGRSCGTLIDDAKEEDPDSNTCRQMIGAESICCPEVDPDDPDMPDIPDGDIEPTDPEENEEPTDPDDNEEPTDPEENEEPTDPEDNEEPTDPEENENPCSFCSSEGGDTTIANADLVVDEEAGRTCSELVFDARTLSDNSETCVAFKRLESTCCPAEDGTNTPVGEADVPCPVCSGGITVGDDTSLGGGGRTCGGLVIDALDVEEGSRECDRMMGAEESCCPPEEPIVDVESPCPVCESGLTVEDDTPLGDQGRTCGTLIEDALSTEEDSNVCERMKGAEETCCPAVEDETVVPCSVCLAGGITVDEDTPLGEIEGTCGDLLQNDMQIEAFSEEDCAALTLEAELTCCPAETTVVDDACPVCVGGIEVEDDTPLLEGGTCGGLVEDALEIEADSQACTATKESEAICCPEAAAAATEENELSCPICLEGLSVDGETEVSGGKTCAILLEDAMDTDPESETCAAMKSSELVCCPSMADNPCSVCSEAGGITVDDDVSIGSGRTCGGLIVDAKNVEEDSNVCTAMKGAEATCCPDGTTVAPGPTPAPQVATTPAPVEAETIDKGNVTITPAPVALTTLAPIEPAVTPSPVTPSPVTPAPTSPPPVTTEEPTKSPQGAGLEFAPGSSEPVNKEPPAPPSGASRMRGVASTGLAGFILAFLTCM